MGQNEDFINKIAPIIRKYAAERGYKVASPIIAQACLESSYGRSKLSAVYHNYFGLKCGKSWKGKEITANTKEEFTPGTLTEIKDAFRVYGSMEEGVRGYFDFINTNRYSNLKLATTPKQYLETIKADGYATDSKYVSKNMSVIEKYSLTQYDTMAANDTTAPKTGNPYPEPTGVIRLGSRGDHVRWLQYELKCHGAKLVVDGMAGAKTIQALKNFQMANGLEADGVCGEKTRAALRG